MKYLFIMLSLLIVGSVTYAGDQLWCNTKYPETVYVSNQDLCLCPTHSPYGWNPYTYCGLLNGEQWVDIQSQRFGSKQYYISPSSSVTSSFAVRKPRKKNVELYECTSDGWNRIYSNANIGLSYRKGVEYSEGDIVSLIQGTSAPRIKDCVTYHDTSSMRDDARKATVNRISDAVLSYYRDYGRLPYYSNGRMVSIDVSLQSLFGNYISYIPSYPSSDDYGYISTRDGFIVYAQLEGNQGNTSYPSIDNLSYITYRGSYYIAGSMQITPSYSNYGRCGNGLIERGEQCDGGAFDSSIAAKYIEGSYDRYHSMIYQLPRSIKGSTNSYKISCDAKCRLVVDGKSASRCDYFDGSVITYTRLQQKTLEINQSFCELGSLTNVYTDRNSARIYYTCKGLNGGSSEQCYIQYIKDTSSIDGGGYCNDPRATNYLSYGMCRYWR